MKQVILDLKKQYAAPVYDKENIHLICDEDLTLMIDDQLFFEMILLEIRGKYISHATYKKKEMAKLETKKMTDIKFIEENFNEDSVQLLEQKRQELFEIRQKKVDGMIIRSRAKWTGNGEKKIEIFLQPGKREILYRGPCVLYKKTMEKLWSTVNQ